MALRLGVAERIVVSSSESADIFVRDSVVNFTLTGDRLHIEKGQVFFNTRLSETDDIVLHEGDVIFFDGKLIIWSRDYLRINALNVVVNLQEYIIFLFLWRRCVELSRMRMGVRLGGILIIGNHKRRNIQSGKTQGQMFECFRILQTHMAFFLNLLKTVIETVSMNFQA